MRSSYGQKSFLAFVLLTATVAPVPSVSADVVTNWVAYNDHRPGPTPPPAGQWGTAPNVSGYDMRVGPGGPLTDFLNGQPLTATLEVVAAGSPDDFGTAVEPNSGTPAYDMFFGIVDVANENSVIGVRYSTETGVTLTFNNLNPSKYYLFRGTSVRGGSYPLRWAVATISGADTYIDAHLNGTGPGVLTAVNFPEDLAPGQAAWNSGDNRHGAVIGWDFISPGEDGSFSITSTQYVAHISATQEAGTANYGYAISAMLLAEVEIGPPVIVTEPAETTTVEQNRRFTLSVTASGTPLLYQWYKEGAGAIPGATFASYSVPLAALSDAGNYYVVVHNPAASVTSRVAQVTVNADTTRPAVATVFSYPNFDMEFQTAALDRVIVEFNEALQPQSVLEANNFLIPNIGNPTSVTLSNDSVVLTFASALAEDTEYALRISNVLDLVGNRINEDAPVEALFRTWMSGPGNGLLFEAFNTGGGVDVPSLTSSPLYPDNPSLRTNLWAYDSRVIFPDDTQENYGSRLRGVFIPPVSGNWLFFLRTFDRGTVYFNPNGLDPAGAVPLIAETTGNNPRPWSKLISDPVSLRAGQAYYIEGLQKAAAGVDVMKVAARLVDTGLPLPVDSLDTIIDPNSMMGAAICFPYAPRDLGGPLTIVQRPADTTVEENHPATFSAQLSNPSGLPVSYQWFRNDVEVPGANGPTFAYLTTLEDDGDTVSVRAAKLGSVVTSQPATVNVVPDTTAPQALRATVSASSLSNIVVRFSERINRDEAEDMFGYILQESQSSPATAILEPDEMTVTLSFTEELVLNTTYHLEVTNIRDLVGIRIEPDPTVLTFIAGDEGGGEAPALSIALSQNDAIISWPAPSTGFVLEETSEILSPGTSIVWTPVAAMPVVLNGQNTVTNAVGSANRFFRLRR